MKKFNITVNGVTYEVDVEEVGQGGAAPQAPAQPAAQSAPQPAAKPAQAAAPKKEELKKEEPKKEAAPAAPAGAQTVEAPMPGNIWKVLVKEGDPVEEG
ncbi:acetyl-CoA carboxylase biotin carboxyl carrier protein subunit, partial [Isachenkonia alkalipeptolytica]